MVSEERYNAIHSSVCFINYFYVISHFMSYDEEFLNEDERVLYPYIIRSNYEDNGYLPFIVSLLHNSTYTMIVKDEGFEQGLPDGDWLDDAVERVESGDVVVTCNAYTDSVNGKRVMTPEGCLFMKSLSLRSIIVNTAFQINDLDPFFFFQQAFQCLFGSATVVLPCTTYQSPHSRQSFSLISSLFHTESAISSSCRKELGLQPVGCQTRPKKIKEVSILLSQFKREYIYEQLEAILTSSIPVAEILLYQNNVNKNYQMVFQKWPMITHIWSTNWSSPFFMRHLLPLLFRTPYHIVFDDDIIPGEETIGKLLRTVRQYNAPSGVGGRVITESNYREGSYRMYCVDCSLRLVTLPVDYVIQVYAKTAVMGKVYWRYRPWTHRNGDDIHGSMSWFFECGRRAMRPALVGPALYKNYGVDSVASFRTVTHNIVRPQAYRNWLMAGYESYYDRLVKVEYPAWNRTLADAYLRQYVKYFCCVC